MAQFAYLGSSLAAMQSPTKVIYSRQQTDVNFIVLSVSRARLDSEAFEA